MLDAFRIRRHQGLTLALIACALLARILVPQGWMPVQSANGWTITICTGMGPVQMQLPAAMDPTAKGMHHGSDQPDHGANDHPCTFGGLSLALDSPRLATMALPTPIGEPALVILAVAVGIGRGLAAPPPPATGPPALF